LVVRKEMAGKQRKEKFSRVDHWKLVCTEMRKQQDRAFMKAVEMGKIPDERGIDWEHLEEKWDRVMQVFERNILPNAKFFGKAAEGGSIKKALEEWQERLKCYK